MAPKIEKLTEIGSVELGEGPHWDAETQALYFVDILGHYIHKYVPSTKKHTKAIIGKYVSFIIPVEGKKDQFVIGVEKEVLLITWNGESKKPSYVELLYEVDQNKDTVLNDAKCDPSGRLWTGTMAKLSESEQLIVERKGSLFSFENKIVNTHLTQIGASNGLAFDLKLKKFYYVDSFNGTLDQYDYDIKTGTISNGKPIFTLKEGNIEDLQALDGLAIDADGNLWVAVYNLSKVIKIDPRKPETVMESIIFPTPQITSVAFGGTNLDELYVTSGRITSKDGTSIPEGGTTFKVTGLNAKGLPGVRVVL